MRLPARRVATTSRASWMPWRVRSGGRVKGPLAMMGMEGSSGQRWWKQVYSLWQAKARQRMPSEFQWKHWRGAKGSSLAAWYSFMLPPTPRGVYQAKCCGMSGCGWTWYIFRVLIRELSAFSCQLSAVKCEGPARTPGLAVFDCLLLKYTKWSKTQLYFWEKFDLVWMVDCGPVLHRVRGLTPRRAPAKTAYPASACSLG